MKNQIAVSCIPYFAFIHTFALASHDGAYQAHEARDGGANLSDIITGILIFFAIIAAYKLIQVAFNSIVEAAIRRETRIEAEIHKNNIWLFIIDFYEGDPAERKYTVRHRTKGIKRQGALYYKDRDSVIASINSIRSTRESRGDDLGYAVQDNTGDFPELKD